MKEEANEKLKRAIEILKNHGGAADVNRAVDLLQEVQPVVQAYSDVPQDEENPDPADDAGIFETAAAARDAKPED